MNSPEFTGERFLPGQGGCQLAYEHVHRYLYAARWARGKRVLDVASGAGYGAALLAGEARLVWALDLNGPTIRWAREAYGRENLLFLQGDATRLPIRTGSVDLVVALEVLEHLENQEGLVQELARVTAHGGAVLISTPDKSTYSGTRDHPNPFHLHEFQKGELLSFLGQHFPEVHLLGQQVRAGSLITRDSEARGNSEVIVQSPLSEKLPAVAPTYLLALCSREPGSLEVPQGSAYLDPTDGLFAEVKSEISHLNEEIEKLGSWCRDLEREVALRDKTIRGLQEHLRALEERMTQEVGQRDQTIRDLQQEFEDRTRWALSLVEDVKIRDRQLEHANSELQRVGDHLARIRHARLYRALCRLGILPE